MAEPERRLPRFAAPEIEVERRSDGGMILRSPQPLGPVARRVGDRLAHWAAAAPQRLFLAERDGTDWRRLTYGAAHAAARAIGQELLDRGLGPERPLMILSDNGIDHALMALGALYAGVPVAPVSAAYSLVSRDFAKLRAVAEQLTPGLAFADDGARYGAALAAVAAMGAAIAVSRDPPSGLAASAIDELRATRPRRELDDAFHGVGPDTVAKILFTSGSTGDPKGVVNTHRMLCSNQAAYLQAWRFLGDRPPVTLDWLPWSHTFGGNSTFNMMLFNGGTLFIDNGKPVPGLIERTAENLRALSPTIYFNVPRGYALLLDHLEREPALARRFFAELDLLCYAGAALPQSLWQRLDALALAAIGRKPAFVSAWGTTETAPCATIVHYAMERAGNVGLPVSGTEIKLVPEAGGRLEIRVRGPNITPGYWRRPDLTAEAFDAEGFYRPGDAMRLEDARDPVKGLVFDGRLGENFKLTSGTWVTVGALRVAVIAAAAPVIEDAVITGHDRDELGLLVFPSLAGCRSLAPELAEASLAELVAHPKVLAALASGLKRHNEAASGSSQRIARALLLSEPPSIDRGEITDKGYINQRAVLTHRAALLALLYAASPGPGVIVS